MSPATVLEVAISCRETNGVDKRKMNSCRLGLVWKLTAVDDDGFFFFWTVDDVVSSMLQPRGSSNPQSPTWTDADAEEWAAAAGQGHRRTQSLPPRLMLDLGRPSQVYYFCR